MPALVSSFIFPDAIKRFLNKEADADTDTHKMLLVGATCSVASDDTATTLAGISTLDESTGTNYARETLASISIDTSDAANGNVFVDATDVTFSNITDAALYGAIIYNDDITGDPPVVYLDFGSSQSVTASDFIVQFASTGYLLISSLGDN